MQSSTSRRILSASTLLIDSATVIEEGGLLVNPEGQIDELFAGAGACRRAAASLGVPLERHEGWLTPGFVCAHAHLDLGALSAKVPAGETFPEWIGALLRERVQLSEEAIRGGQVQSARDLLESGTTLVGDIDSLGLPHASMGPRAVRYRELLDLGGDPERRREVEKGLQAFHERERAPFEHFGLSPHAPYTSSVEWMQSIAACDDLPVAIHWAETSEEREWLERGEGAFARLFQGGAGSSGLSGLDRIEQGGLLRSSTALIHGNDPQEGEVARVARSGASLVHCPGATRFFDREPFPLEGWRSAGVPIALGTDSAAGNDSLSMLRELRLFRESHPKLNAAECFDMATVFGARAVGLQGRAGALLQGAFADLCLWPIPPRAGLGEGLECLTRGGVNRPLGLWIHGSARSLPA